MVPTPHRDGAPHCMAAGLAATKEAEGTTGENETAPGSMMRGAAGTSSETATWACAVAATSVKIVPSSRVPTVFRMTIIQALTGCDRVLCIGIRPLPELPPASRISDNSWKQASPMPHRGVTCGDLGSRGQSRDGRGRSGEGWGSELPGKEGCRGRWMTARGWIFCITPSCVSPPRPSSRAHWR